MAEFDDKQFDFNKHPFHEGATPLEKAFLTAGGFVLLGLAGQIISEHFPEIQKIIDNFRHLIHP